MTEARQDDRRGRGEGPHHGPGAAGVQGPHGQHHDSVLPEQRQVHAAAARRLRELHQPATEQAGRDDRSGATLVTSTNTLWTAGLVTALILLLPCHLIAYTMT